MAVRGKLARAARTLRGSDAEPTSPPSSPFLPAPPPITDTATAEERAILEHAAGFTMTGPERMLANIDAVDYIVRCNVPGALVECGVWRGGSVLVMVERLVQLKATDREIYLFDTFAGMTAPTEEDVSPYLEPAVQTWAATPQGEVPWADVLGDPALYQVDGVRRLLLSSGYPENRLHFVRGPVEDTVPAQAPDEIALLRLDTDFYGSTAHEMRHMYPRLSDGGVLIIDDYGHWQGAQQAVDEYFAGASQPILLSRIDYSGRIGVKR